MLSAFSEIRSVMTENSLLKYFHLTSKYLNRVMEVGLKFNICHLTVECCGDPCSGAGEAGAWCPVLVYKVNILSVGGDRTGSHS